MTPTTLLVLACATLAAGQRPFFAGSKPIGYPEVTTEALGDRFGEVDGTTQRLPIEANGDRELVDRLSKLPIDNQPFWLINWQALQANREKPQSYPQKPNQFIDSFQSGGNSDTSSVNSSSSRGNPVADSPNSTNKTTSVPNASPSVVNRNGDNSDVATSNRFGEVEIPNVSSTDQESKFQNSTSGSGSSISNTTNSGDKKTVYFVPKPYYL